jgi:hypothetical protein
VLLFNCGNLHTVTGLQARTAPNLSSISNRGKRLFSSQKHVNSKLNPQTILFNWSWGKAVRACSWQPTMTKSQDEGWASCNSSECTYCCCCQRQTWCQIQQYIKIAAFCVRHVGISNNIALYRYTAVLIISTILLRRDKQLRVTCLLLKYSLQTCDMLSL